MTIKIIYPYVTKKCIRKNVLLAFFASLPKDVNSLIHGVALKVSFLNLLIIWRILFSSSFYPTPSSSNMTLNSSCLYSLSFHSPTYHFISHLLSTHHQYKCDGR